MRKLFAAFAAFIAASLLPMTSATAEPGSAPPWPAICEEVPDLREVHVATPTGEELTVLDLPDGFISIPVLTEGELYNQALYLTNTSRTNMLLKIHIVGIDVPDFYTSGPTPVTFKVGSSPWEISPKTGETLTFELRLLESGNSRELHIGTQMLSTSERIVKDEGLAGIYRVDISAEADCRLIDDPRYPAPAVPDNAPAESIHPPVTPGDGSGKPGNHSEAPGKDRSGSVSEPGDEKSAESVGSKTVGHNGLEPESPHPSGNTHIPAHSAKAGAGDELAWTGSDVQTLGILAGGLMIIGVLLRRRRGAQS